MTQTCKPSAENLRGMHICQVCRILTQASTLWLFLHGSVCDNAALTICRELGGRACTSVDFSSDFIPGCLHGIYAGHLPVHNVSRAFCLQKCLPDAVHVTLGCPPSCKQESCEQGLMMLHYGSGAFYLLHCLADALDVTFDCLPSFKEERH